MANTYFRFKQFTVNQDRTAMKVTTDGCLFGAWVAEEISKHNIGVENILDIGAGTGLLSLTIAQKTKTSITAVEIDEAAADQAMENVKSSPWPDSIEVVHADILQWKSGKKFDIIVSNPPFYERELASPVRGRNVAHHSDGLLLQDLLTTAKNLLKPDGTIYLLLPFKRDEEIAALLDAANIFTRIRVLVHASPSHQPTRLFEKKDVPSENFIIHTIADITDDADGSVPINAGDQTIEDPVYGIDKMSLQKTAPYLPGSVDVMAVGNLPNELPRDASRYFGEQLIKFILQDLVAGSSPIIERATMAKGGNLTEGYRYLNDYAAGV